jgi:cob(I)alamin adenosyltransferase
MGRIHLYYGEGKGKTTAAIGLAIRAAGAGKRVAFVQFDKGQETDDSPCSERNVLRCIAELDLYCFGCSRVGGEQGFRFENTEEDFEEALHGLEVARQLVRLPQYFLIVLDEIVSCVTSGLLKEEDIVQLLHEHKHGGTAELVLTGRHVSRKLIEMADLVTEMRKVRHYFDQGSQPLRGIEY